MLTNYLCYAILREILKYIRDSNNSYAFLLFFFLISHSTSPMRFSLPALQNPQLLFS